MTEPNKISLSNLVVFAAVAALSILESSPLMAQGNAGGAITAAELNMDGFQFPTDFTATKPPAIPTDPTQLAAYNSSAAVSTYHTALANYAWRLFIAANNGTAATITDGSKRETATSSFLTTGASPSYNGGANPLVFEALYHRTEAYPYYTGTQPATQGGAAPKYRTFYGSGDDITAYTPAAAYSNYVNLDETNQIAQNMLYYRGSNDADFPVLYMAKVNRTELDYAFAQSKAGQKPKKGKTWNFLPGVIEVKAAWRRVTDFKTAADANKYHQATGTYYVSDKGEGQPSTPPIVETFALIALHIIQKTETYPNFIFSTFEHVDAATKEDPQYQLLYNNLIYDTTKLGVNVYGAYDQNAPNLPVHANALTTLPPGAPSATTGIPNAGAAPGNFVDGTYGHIVQPSTITAETNDVNKAVLSLIPATSVWANYRLKGVQSLPTSVDGTRDYYLANIVVETTRPGVQLFRGGVVNPVANPAPTTYDFTNNRTMLNISDLGDITRKEGKPVPAPYAVMGGCMGCHGAGAQQNGFDFSFLSPGALGKGRSVDSVPSKDLTPDEVTAHHTAITAQRTADLYPEDSDE